MASALLARANGKLPVQEKVQQGGPTQAPVLAQRLRAASGSWSHSSPTARPQVSACPRGLSICSPLPGLGDPMGAPESSPSPAACWAPLSGSGDGEAVGLV